MVTTGLGVCLAPCYDEASNIREGIHHEHSACPSGPLGACARCGLDGRPACVGGQTGIGRKPRSGPRPRPRSGQGSSASPKLSPDGRRCAHRRFCWREFEHPLWRRAAACRSILFCATCVGGQLPTRLGQEEQWLLAARSSQAVATGRAIAWRCGDLPLTPRTGNAIGRPACGPQIRSRRGRHPVDSRGDGYGD